ncbi:hypothetical protein A2U01_0050715, partial [Trifolium medium]|nr:hypothetical protein [Trifolium medium]
SSLGERKRERRRATTHFLAGARENDNSSPDLAGREAASSIGDSVV